MTGQLTITQPGEILAADTHSVLPALIAAAGDRAARRYVEFFAATIRNTHRGDDDVAGGSVTPRAISRGWQHGISFPRMPLDGG